MVTFAQAQERAEEWINGDVPGYQHREVRVREFDLGFVVWAEDRENGPVSDGGAQRLVIARDSGEATLWPSLAVGEVIRRYEEEYGLTDMAPEDAVPAPPERVDLNQTSFLLTPPEWLQEAADKLGIPDRRSEARGSRGEPSGAPGASVAPGAPEAPGAPGGPAAPEVPGVPGAPAASEAPGAPAEPFAPAASETAPAAPASPAAPEGPAAPFAPAGPEAPAAPAAPGGGTPWPVAGGSAEDAVSEPLPEPVAEFDDDLPATSAGVPADATPWAGTDTNADAGEDHSVPLPATVFAPQLTGLDEDETPPPAATPDAKTALMHGGSQLPATAIAPALSNPTPGSPTPSSPAPGAPAGPPPAGPSTPLPPPSGAPGGPTAQSPNAPQPPVGSPAPLPPPSGAPAGQSPNAPYPPAGSSAPLPPPSGAPAAQSPNAPQPPAGSPTPPPGAPDSSAYGYPQPPAVPGAGDIAAAATSKASASTPPPSGPGAPGTPAGGYVPTQLVSSLGPDGPKPPAAPAAPAAPGTPPGGVHHAATMLADPSMGGGLKPPGAPGAPGAPGTPPGAPQPPGPPGAPGAPGAPQPPGPPGAPGTPPGGVHHAATMLADPSMGGGLKPPGAPGAPQPPGPPGAPGAPGAPQPPGPPGAPGAPGAPGTPPPGGGVHHAATMLAGPAVGGPGAPGMPPPPAPGQHAPGMPGGPGGPGMPANPGGPGAPGMPAAPQPYGYPHPPTGQPTVGPGYQAVLRYRAADGSEQQLIRRSAPGTPHPEWQILHELRGMNVPPQQVLELHTELESCELPGAYCARMIRETWPQARITSIAPYGRDHASRQQGVQQLLAHQGELHQVADGPARPAPVRAPLQQMPPAQPIPPEGVAQELAAAFGPGIFRFDQRAVSRQGVPDIVAHTLVVAGLPVDFGPFFWAQAQPGRPVPTLAELAQERGVQPASDAGSYLVMGSDFGRALCVQYGTANIVAVPVEAGPGGAPVPPQFVNTGLPEFARCMALLGRMWRLRFGLNQEQAGRWTVDFQNQLAALDPAALASPESWWSVLLEQMWDGLL
ncbi:SUKH-4 family immunity protein [Streptomyces sp. Je 1-369]|uniref:SUKH-4 family immunity protein n=1 Tax=Streptomyces sp. Je 1-369 TaxID=2966192 RepID=UPI002286980F|nr:SUKH-4 family immunity protein [Streptomyces sp. Je 1-369]WAL95988.1 SUKH-4 family immunity protein [Streptomyces sp. Je 1-369]